MQPHEMAEKRRVYIDGVEKEGLVWAAELVKEKGTVEVPEFRKIRTIQTGITKYPAYELRYKLTRGTDTKEFLENWYNNDEIKDVTIVRCDAHGSEFGRVLLTQCEAQKIQILPEADLSSPQYAQASITILPWEITELQPE